MQVNFTGHGLEVTQALRSFTEDKLNKLERHFDRIIAINIIFGVEDKLRQNAEGTIFIANGELHASAQSKDMYTAVDSLVDKLDRQLIKHKEKLIDQRDHRDHREH